MFWPVQSHINNMRRRFPAMQFSRRPGGLLAWQGPVKPAGQEYEIRITAQSGAGPRPGRHPVITQWPEVEILAPAPVRRLEAPDEPIPHLEYAERPGVRALCLYDTQRWEWHPGVSIAELVPWASEWLLCYELWHATGVWQGG